MPEGDTIYRAAAALRTALVGKVTARFDAPRLGGPLPTPGHVIESVESHGKHLEMTWDDGLVLHTHMKMSGSWHLYRPGEKWRAPEHQARVVIEVEDWIAVCFNAPVVETYRAPDKRRHPGFGRLGPDLCKQGADLTTCVQRLLAYADRDRSIAEVLLDQHVACGVGNVYKSEVLFACGVSPFTPVEQVDRRTAELLIRTAARMLRANLQSAGRITTADVPGGLAVYGRNGKPCARCHTTIRARRHGEQARSSFWCPHCQPGYEPDVTPSGELAWSSAARQAGAADPHPAAVVFLHDIAHRRRRPD